MASNESTSGDSRQDLPVYQKVMVGAGMVLPMTLLAVWHTYAVAFFEKVLELPAKSTGTIILIGQTAGALSAPLVGIWSDQLSCRLGRRRLTHFVGAVAAVVPFVFIWHECISCENSPTAYQTVYFASLAALCLVGTTAMQTAIYALIPELAHDTSVNVEINSYCAAFSTMFQLLAYVVIWGLLAYMKEGGTDTAKLSPHDQTLFTILAVVVVAVCAVMAVFFYSCVRENPTAEEPKLKWYKWFQTINFYMVNCMYITSQILHTTPKIYLPLYLMESLNMDKTSIAKGPIILYLSALIASIVTKWINRFIALKMLYTLSQLIPCISLIWLWFMESTDDNQSAFNLSRDSIYGAVILLGVGVGMTWVTSMAMVANLVGRYTGSSAFIYGVGFLLIDFAAGAVVKVIQQSEPSSQSRLPGFYRKALVIPVLTALCLGLLSVMVMACHEKCMDRTKEDVANDKEANGSASRHVGDEDSKDRRDSTSPHSGEGDHLLSESECESPDAIDM